MKLTSEQETLIPVIRDKWLDMVFKERKFDIHSATKGVKFIYQISGLKEPLVIALQSPLACQFAANLTKRAQVWAQVRDQVRAQVWDQVRDQVGAQVWDQKIKYYYPAGCDLLSDAGWISFYDYFREIGIVEHEQFDQYEDYISSGACYSLFFDGLAIICEPPVDIKRDGQNRLHCPDGPAVLWRDGYKNYFWHGVSAPDKLLETPEQITRDDFIREQNAEVRRAYMEKLESGRFFQLMDMDIIDRDKVGRGEYAKEYTLYRTKEPDPVAGEHIQFVNVICHSTEREYLLCVPPGIDNVYSAVAWTFSKTASDYSPLAEA